jgi:hypothetical protein
MNTYQINTGKNGLYSIEIQHNSVVSGPDAVIVLCSAIENSRILYVARTMKEAESTIMPRLLREGYKVLKDTYIAYGPNNNTVIIASIPNENTKYNFQGMELTHIVAPYMSVSIEDNLKLRFRGKLVSYIHYTNPL